MGCSSSAPSKARDSSRFRSVTSNEYLSTTEESKSCVTQPTPCTLGRESTFHGNAQRESLAPLEKPKASVVPTANGVISLRERPLAKEVGLGKEATDRSGTPEKIQPLQGLEESEPPQPGAEEKKKDAETVTEVQALKEYAQTELSKAKGQSLKAVGEENSPGAGEYAENPSTVRVMKPLGTTENILLLKTGRELQPPEAIGKDEQTQILEATSKENKSPEILERRRFVETSEEQQLQETVGKDEQSQLLETIPKENVTSDILDRSQLVQTPIMNDSLRKTSEGPGYVEQIQPENIVGSMENPEGIAETVANMEMARKIHTHKAEQHTEGETGEKVKTEMENEKVSESAETKEDETREAVDLSAATETGMATEG